MRVVLANEPRYEREVLAAALRELRPGLEVAEVEPDRLGGELTAPPVRLVVCSAATAAVRAGVPAWVLLYPDDAAHAVVCLDGDERAVPGFGLADLVAAVDAAAGGAVGGCPAENGRAGDVDDHDVGRVIASGTPVTGADGAPVGQVVADGAAQLLIEEPSAGGEAPQLHVPRDAVVEVGEGGVVLDITREEAVAAERERAELLALLAAAPLTPDRARLLRALLEATHAPAAGADVA